MNCLPGDIARCVGRQKHRRHQRTQWAVVGRLRLMLEEPPHKMFNVTQTYALFTATLCWVMQRIRIKPNEVKTWNDRLATDTLNKFRNERIIEKPWSIQLVASGRIARIGPYSVHVPAPVNFSDHTVDRFLINLRDAAAHGDARNIEPFHIEGRVEGERLLAGFTFLCSEKDRNDSRKISWSGQITLLEDDMRRIGGLLPKVYCDALRHSEAHRHDGHFGSDAARSIREDVA
jgi:hypothetical protein